MAKKRKAAELTIDINANVAKLATDMGKAVGILGGFEKQVNKIGTGLKILGGALAGAATIKGIQTLVSAVNSLAAQGDKVADIADNFRALGGSAAALGDAQRAMLGTASAFDLMAVANEGLLRGIPNFNQHFGQLADLAKRFASATGQDAVQVLNQLTDAFARGKAKGLEPFGFALEGIKGKAAVTKEALAQLPSIISALAPETASVTDAQEALTVAWDDGFKKLGMGINASNELRDSYQELTNVINSLDWESLGKDIGEFAAALSQLATSILPAVTDGIRNFTAGIEVLFGTSSRGQAAQLLGDINNLKKSLSGLDEDQARNPLKGKLGSKLSNYIFGDPEEARKGLQAQLTSKEAEYQAFIQKMKGEQIKAETEVSTNASSGIKRLEAERLQSIQRTTKAESNSVQKRIEALRTAFEKETATLQTNALENSVNKAIESLDRGGFEQAAQKLKEAYKQSIIDAHKEALSSGAVTQDAVEKYAEDSATHQVEAFKEKFQEASKENAEQLRKDMETAYADSVSAWSDLFLAAIDGNLASFEQILKRVLAEFAGSLATQLFGATGGLVEALTSGKGLGGALLNSIMSIFDSGWQGKGLLDLFKSGAEAVGWTSMFSGGAAAAGVSAIPPELAAPMGIGVASSVSGGTVLAPEAAGAGGLLGTAGPYAAAAIAIGAVAHSMWPKIEKLFGGGISNKETLARRHGGEKIEELISQLSTVAFYNKDKQLQVLDAKSYDFVTGRGGPFNQKGWADEMNKWGEDARRTFTGLGQALKEIWGLGEDVGAQLGFLLGENFAGNIDNARLLVQQLGLSYQELEDAMIQAGRSGEMSWHEVETGLQGLSDAFAPGLKAVGDLRGAFDELMDSGGRGVAALKGVKDIAIEAMEAGAKTLDDLKQRLLQTGVDPAIVDAFMQALAQRGIQTLQQLADASDRVAGGIVADLESNSGVVAEKWKEIGDNVKKVKDELEGIPSNIAITFDVSANIDDNAKKLLESQAMSSQDVKTLKTLSQSTGSSTIGNSQSKGPYKAPSIADTSVHTRGLQIHIDARGAQRGVETDIRQALASVEERAVRRSVRAVQDAQQRGRM